MGPVEITERLGQIAEGSLRVSCATMAIARILGVWEPLCVYL